MNVTDSPSITNSNNKELKKLRHVSQEFEEMFVAMMLKEMHKPLGKTGFLDNGPYEKMFRDMLIDERAKEMAANGGLGIAELMVRQLQPSAVGQAGKLTSQLYAQQEKYIPSTVLLDTKIR